MNDLFHISQELLPAFQTLLTKVNEQEKRAVALGEKLMRQLEKLLKSGVIDDYELDAELSCFSSNEKINRKYHVEEGNPILMLPDYMLPNIRRNICLTTNWNEYEHEEGTLLKGLYFGYAMHCICFHHTLSLEDILAIDSIWIDLKTDYQFVTNL
jgi:hypothetical protein